MQSLDRRSALATLGMAGAVALVTPAAALPKLTATDDQHLLDLWQRFVAGEVQYADAVSKSDHADWNAREEFHALPCPWTPLEIESSKYKAVEVSERQTVIEKTKNDVTTQVDKNGPWLVQEYQPLASDHPFGVQYRDGYPLRWVPYSGANSWEEAYAMAKARAGKEWRSFDGKRAAISRKHQVRKYEAGVEAASDACGDIRHAIATAPVTGALALAIKLAMWGWGNDIDYKSASTPDDPWDAIEAAAVASLYRHAVKESGFDPLAQVRKALRDHERRCFGTA